MTEAERTSYAREAATLLAQVASEDKEPLKGDLTSAEPALAVAIGAAHTAPAAAVALGNVPDPDARRSLADIVLDPSQPAPSRRQSALQLVHSIKHFGRLLTGDQEARLVNSLRQETDPNARTDLSTILRALLPLRPTGLSQSLAPFIPAAEPMLMPGPPAPP